MDSKHISYTLGIIGMGYIGTVQYEALTKSPESDFRIVAVAGHGKKKDFPVPFHTDHKHLLSDPQIQAVSINTPPNTHYRLVMEALEAEKHVFVEKPPALILSELEDMIRTAKEKNRVLFMAFHARYNPSVMAVKKLLAKQQVSRVAIDYRELVFHYHKPDGWIFKKEIGGGGVLMDSGINALSIVTCVIPEFSAHITSAVFTAPKRYVYKGTALSFEVETQADVSFTFGSDAEGVLHQEWLYEGPHEIRQITFETKEKDSYMVDIVSNVLVANGKEKQCKKSSGREEQCAEYASMYRDFAEHISKNESLTSTKELAFVLEAYKKGTYKLR